MPIKPDGSCAHLEGNRCAIYEQRPEICRVEGNYSANAAVCLWLQKLEGLGPEWAPKLERIEA